MHAATFEKCVASAEAASAVEVASAEAAVLAASAEAAEDSDNIFSFL